MKNLQNNVQTKLDQYMEIEEQTNELKKTTEEYVDYLMGLNPKYVQGGEEGKEIQILEAYEKLELELTSAGLYAAEKELTKAENDLINYFYNHINEFVFTTETVIEFVNNKETYYSNRVRRDQLVYALLNA